MIAVVQTGFSPPELDPIVEAGAFKVLRTAAGRYVFFHVDKGGEDERFIDPTDGEVLLELRFFRREREAHTWVTQDIALRGAQTRGVQ